MSVSSGSQGVDPSHEILEGPAEEEDDDEFTEEEWAIAQMKLRAEELRVGLTLVQRARLRKAISRGGVVDPRRFYRGTGLCPSWISESDTSQPSSACGAGTKG